MAQRPKTQTEIQAIIDKISFMDRRFRLIKKGRDERGNAFFCLQLEYMEEDVDHPGKVELQRARKWYISPYSTETEIVETAFAACRRSMEHVLKEHFTYKGQRVYSPHFDINARLKMCQEFKSDSRSPLYNQWEIWLLAVAKDHHKSGLVGEAIDLQEIISTQGIPNEITFKKVIKQVLCWDRESILDAVKEASNGIAP